MTAIEGDAFWAWAVIEALRLTGARIEEVLELTQLSVRHYTPPTTHALVPLLHIAPSKLDAERVIPMSPELVDVLLAVQVLRWCGRGRVARVNGWYLDLEVNDTNVRMATMMASTPTEEDMGSTATVRMVSPATRIPKPRRMERRAWR